MSCSDCSLVRVLCWENVPHRTRTKSWTTRRPDTATRCSADLQWRRYCNHSTSSYYEYTWAKQRAEQIQQRDAQLTFSDVDTAITAPVHTMNIHEPNNAQSRYSNEMLSWPSVIPILQSQHQFTLWIYMSQTMRRANTAMRCSTDLQWYRYCNHNTSSYKVEEGSQSRTLAFNCGHG